MGWLRKITGRGGKGRPSKLERDPKAEARFRDQELGGLVDAHVNATPPLQRPPRLVRHPVPSKVKPQTSSKRGGKTTCAKKRAQRGWGPVPGQQFVVDGQAAPTVPLPTTTDLKNEQLAQSARRAS